MRTRFLGLVAIAAVVVGCSNVVVSSGEAAPDRRAGPALAFAAEGVPATLGAAPSQELAGTGAPKPRLRIFAGVVSNMSQATAPGPGVPAMWNYDGWIGAKAGKAMCHDIGADHPCEYSEVRAAELAGELAGLGDQTLWIWRLKETVLVDGKPSPAGIGGRCDDWVIDANYDCGPEFDGEYAVVAGGTISYVFDPDTGYDGSHTSKHYNGIGCGARRNIVCCQAQ